METGSWRKCCKLTRNFYGAKEMDVDTPLSVQGPMSSRFR